MRFTVWISAPTPSAVFSTARVSTLWKAISAFTLEWIEYHIKKCDVVLPLVAIATPIEYTRNPAARVRAGFRREPENHPRLREIQ